jgi:predicted RND superfamily exporter protein
MLKLSQWVIAYRKLILVIFLLTSLFSVLAIPLVKVNYDNSRYLVIPIQKLHHSGKYEPLLQNDGATYPRSEPPMTALSFA